MDWKPFIYLCLCAIQGRKIWKRSQNIKERQEVEFAVIRMHHQVMQIEKTITELERYADENGRCDCGIDFDEMGKMHAQITDDLYAYASKIEGVDIDHLKRKHLCLPIDQLGNKAK